MLIIEQKKGKTFEKVATFESLPLDHEQIGIFGIIAEVGNDLLYENAKEVSFVFNKERFKVKLA